MKATGSIAEGLDKLRLPPVTGREGLPRVWIAVIGPSSVLFLRRGSGSMERIGGLDPAEQTGSGFIQSVCGWLDAAARQGVFDRLVIAAPPELMAPLRMAMSPALFLRVSAELPLDFAGLDERVRDAALEKAVWL